MNRARVLRLTTAAVAIACALVLVRLVLRIPALAPLDPNEGWNAYHAAAVLGGGALYPTNASLYFNNYPPISFHVVAWLARVTGDAIAAGRALSIASFLWMLAMIGVSARALQADRNAAAFGCAFAAAVFLAYSHYVGIDDPQLFGHAIATSGMAVALRSPGSRAHAALAAVLCACALFVKPNLVALPLALLVWLSVAHRGVVAAYVAAGLVAAAAFLGASIAAYGSDFPAHLLSPRGYSIDDLLQGSAKWLSKTASFFLPLAWLATRARGDAATSWCAIYAAISVAFGVYFIGGSGVDQNAFFDAYIALALSAAVVLQRTTAPRATAAILACYLVPVAMSVALRAERAWLDPQYWLAPAHERSADFADALAFVRATPGAAACEEQSLCYRAGKPRGVDFVNIGQYIAKRKLPERALLERIEAREFGAIQLLDEPRPESVLSRTLRGSYVVARRDRWGVYYLPRERGR